MRKQTIKSTLEKMNGMEQNTLNLTPEPERNIKYYCTFQDESGKHCENSIEWDTNSYNTVILCNNIDNHCAYRKCTITPYFPDQNNE